MIILASSSPYRRELLARLGKPFESISPEVDETPLPGESPAVLAARLAEAKAQAVVSQLSTRPGEARSAPGTLVIGSDQTATLDGQVTIGKPGSHDRAVAQLQMASGKKMQFFTAVAMIEADTGKILQETVTTEVQFRPLSQIQIETYLHLEKPYDCAGSAKSEGLGISLIESIHNDDPTALVGLPLIVVCRMLADFGQGVLPAIASSGH